MGNTKVIKYIQEVKLLSNNNNRKYKNGTIWKTNSGAELTIMGRVARPYVYPDKKVAYPFILVQFADGTQVETQVNAIKAGSIRNPNKPTICGKGYPGQGPWLTSVGNKNTKEYVLWQNMLERCYNEKYFLTYVDCTVDEKWYNYQTFCFSIQGLEGYKEWKKFGGLYHLDKDIKIPGNRQYNKDTCMFVKKYDNITESNKRGNITGLLYKGTRQIDGQEVLFTNQKEFSLDQGIGAMSVSKGTRNAGKVYAGWKFEIMDEKP